MHSSTDARTSRLVRPLALVAALAALGLALSVIARPAFAGVTYQVPLHEAHQGANSETFQEDEDCGEFSTGVVWHFVLNQYSGNAAELFAEFDSAGNLSTVASKVEQSVQHFYLNTPTDDILLNAYAQTDTDPGDAMLVLSHVCHTGSEETPTPSESASEEPSQPASEAPSEEPSQPASEQPSEEASQPASEAPSEEASQPASEQPSEEASQSAEGSVLGGTGTPAPSLPDGAMGATGGPSPLPTVFFGLILLASLTTLAWVNVKAVRSRA
jgi:hypothetical protein